MQTDIQKDVSRLKRRFLDLAEKCYMQNVYCFSSFLNIAEIAVFYEVRGEFAHVPCTLYGGNEGCERKMVRFGDSVQLGYEEEFPIVCAEVMPLAEKFGEDLSHRDVLGACMSLGIERDTMGDILVHGKYAYIYCTEVIAPYLMEHLTQIRHTRVSCRLFQGELDALKPALEEKEFQVSSERIDAVVAKVYGLSREKSLWLFREKKIFVNGRQQENNSALPKAGDIVSVRGFGRFIYRGITHMTRKGKSNIMVEIYKS